jgi:predicted enzyme related to lactoylglutathione lyase
VKTHLNLATTDLTKSIQFYSILLDAEPKRVLPDYALFVTQEPALELALDLAESVSATADAHFGICMETVDDVDHAIGRLQSAGIAASIEREQTCCYANQSKVWAVDPMGRRWEIYTVHAEAQERDGADSTGCTDADGARNACCAT